MEAKVKETLNYHGNLSDFPTSQGNETLSWLMEPTWWESTDVVIGLLFCRCLHSLVPSTVVRRRRKRKHYLSKARCRRKKCFCAKLVTFWSLLKKDKVTNLKETQLSNPQKYKFDFPRGKEEEIENLGKLHPSWGLVLNTCRHNCIIKRSIPGIRPVCQELTIMSIWVNCVANCVATRTHTHKRLTQCLIQTVAE